MGNAREAGYGLGGDRNAWAVRLTQFVSNIQSIKYPKPRQE